MKNKQHRYKITTKQYDDNNIAQQKLVIYLIVTIPKAVHSNKTYEFNNNIAAGTYKLVEHYK